MILRSPRSSLAEYRVGIEMADTVERAAERARALTVITSAVNVLDYTEATAAHHGRLLAHVVVRARLVVRMT